MKSSKYLQSVSTNTVNTYGSSATNSNSSRNRVGSVAPSISSSYTSSPYGSYSKATRTIFGNNYNSVFLGNSEGLNTPSHLYTGKNCFNYDSRSGPRSYVYDNNFLNKNMKYNNNENNSNINDNNNEDNNDEDNVIRLKNNHSCQPHENVNQFNKKAKGYPDPCPSISQVYIHGMFSQGTEYSFFLPPQEQNRYLGKRVSTSVCMQQAPRS